MVTVSGGCYYYLEAYDISAQVVRSRGFESVWLDFGVSILDYCYTAQTFGLNNWLEGDAFYQDGEACERST